MSFEHLLPSLLTRAKKRLGRGIGSGKGGHTSSRGSKGQKSRRGAKVPLRFEGGNLPLIKRLPMMRGKGRLKPVRARIELTLTDLDQLTQDQITLDTLRLVKILPNKSTSVKVIATGTINRPVTLTGIRVSSTARQLIEKAGGQVL
ncbi:50S ribosomal protein L15 [Candidatus Woesebacteria bacterium]|nr:50S ribosomal protein L15 [Candidatus Woesebacteria bacterium]